MKAFLCLPFLLMLAGLLTGCAAPSTSQAQSKAVPTMTSSPAPTPAPTPTPEPPPFRIVGYVGYGDVLELIPFDRLTHINYAFLIPNADGTFQDMPNAWKLKDISTSAHAQGVKVLISVGGWGWDDQFEQMAAVPATRQVFVDGLRDFVAEYDLDGVDIDWEYPGPATASAENFVTLMGQLREMLAPQGKLLTAAVAASGSNGAGIRPEVFDLVDFLNIMAYDGPGVNHSSYEYALEALTYWSERGLPPEKTVLGVPFYSRPGEAAYKKLVQVDPAAANSDQWVYNGQMNYYNGLQTMRKKTELAMQRASGIMIWTVAYDAGGEDSLLTAIYQTAHP